MNTPALTSLIACSTVGYMSQTGPVMTVSGPRLDWSDMLEMARIFFSAAASNDAETLGIDHVGAGVDLRTAASLAFGGSKNEPMKATFFLMFGLTSLAPAKKALTSRFTSGMPIAATAPIVPDFDILPAIMPER